MPQKASCFEAAAWVSCLPPTEPDEDLPACDALCPSNTTSPLVWQRVAFILSWLTRQDRAFVGGLKSTPRMMMVPKDAMPSSIGVKTENNFVLLRKHSSLFRCHLCVPEYT